LQILEANHLSKSYSKNGAPIAEEGDAGDLYLLMKLDGFDKFYIFYFLFQVAVV